MTTKVSLPDWLVERAALEEVAPAMRDRLDRADADELARRIAALRAENDAELAAHPAAPAIAQLDARALAERRRTADRRRRHRMWLVGVTSAATVAVVVLAIGLRGGEGQPAAGEDPEEVTRVKGAPRLLAFRLVEDHVEKLEQDALVRPGDIIQLRYNPAGQAHGMIASIDGAGVVTLHFPASEDAPTRLEPRATALPDAYALDDAPHFERFFFITSDRAIDVPQSVAALRALAQRTDAASASPELAAGVRQWSLRLRKPDRQPEDRHD